MADAFEGLLEELKTECGGRLPSAKRLSEATGLSQRDAKELLKELKEQEKARQLEEPVKKKAKTVTPAEPVASDSQPTDQEKTPEKPEPPAECAAEPSAAALALPPTQVTLGLVDEDSDAVGEPKEPVEPLPPVEPVEPVPLLEPGNPKQPADVPPFFGQALKESEEDDEKAGTFVCCFEFDI